MWQKKFKLKSESKNENINNNEINILLLLYNMFCKPSKKQIFNLNKINDQIEKEKLEICIISYGGSCSNQLADVLEQNGYKCRTPIYHNLLCHCPKYVKMNIKTIYIYDNPIKSFISMKRRGPGFWDVNQRKLSNNLNVTLSDENLLKLMIKQFNSWTNIKDDNVLIIKSEELFEEKIVNKLENFLQKKLINFPIKFIEPKSNIKSVDVNLYILFKKYKKKIEKINNFIPNNETIISKNKILSIFICLLIIYK